MRERVVLAHQPTRWLMMKILTLPADDLLSVRKELDCLRAAIAALRATRHPPLAAPQGGFRCAVTAWVYASSCRQPGWQTIPDPDQYPSPVQGVAPAGPVPRRTRY